MNNLSFRSCIRNYKLFTFFNQFRRLNMPNISNTWSTIQNAVKFLFFDFMTK